MPTPSLADKLSDVWLASEENEAWQLIQALAKELNCNPHTLYNLFTNLSCFQPKE